MQAPHDQNTVKAKLGVLCTDGVTLVPIAINNLNGGFEIDATSTTTFGSDSIDFRDQNYQPCWMASRVSDGTPIPVFVNAQGAILITTT